MNKNFFFKIIKLNKEVDKKYIYFKNIHYYNDNLLLIHHLVFIILYINKIYLNVLIIIMY